MNKIATVMGSGEMEGDNDDRKGQIGEVMATFTSQASKPSSHLLRAKMSMPEASWQEIHLLSSALTPLPLLHLPHKIPTMG